MDSSYINYELFKILPKEGRTNYVINLLAEEEKRSMDEWLSHHPFWRFLDRLIEKLFKF